MRIEHRMDWGMTPRTRKRYAMCSCGFRAPARAKLTHGISDARDHLAEVRRECGRQGWRWSNLKVRGGLAVVVEYEIPTSAGVSRSTAVSGPL